MEQITVSHPKSRRGFASLTPERRAEVGRMGGLAAQETGRAHRWSCEEAQAAGRKAQQVRRAKKEGATEQDA